MSGDAAQFTRQPAIKAIADVTQTLPQLIGDQVRAAAQSPDAKPAPRCAPRH
ncbi:hypothetical protein ACFV4T_08775 [Streptomyces sp. NPDC059755]|uniref:hypothetical protein n=1 Tax=Streptomyces sp. NPDC059755 TaxID=3346934 RepID=UPI003652C267